MKMSIMEKECRERWKDRFFYLFILFNKKKTMGGGILYHCCAHHLWLSFQIRICVVTCTTIYTYYGKKERNMWAEGEKNG